MRKRIAEHCSQWLTRRASTISKNDIAELHEKIGARHRSLANRVTALVQAIFNLAIKRELFNGQNPARGHDKFKERKRERIRPFKNWPASTQRSRKKSTGGIARIFRCCC